MKAPEPTDLFESSIHRKDLARKSVKGGVTTIGAQGVKLLLQVLSTAVLARLLTPADFGLIGMVTVVVNFAGMFKDAGLSMATIQKEEITHEQVSTLFWINVVISAFLGLCVLVSSPLVAWFYGKPELAPVTAVLSISFIVSGLTIQHQALQRRRMRFGELALIQIASQVVTLVVTIALALLGWRYWALVGGAMAHALSGTILTVLLCPWIPARVRRGTGAREMVTFGMNVTASNIMSFLVRNADNVLIGRFVGAEALGFYSRAYQLLLFPVQQINMPASQVLIPALSRLQYQPKEFRRYYLKAMGVLTLITTPLITVLLVSAHHIIPIILGDGWDRVVFLFRALSGAALAGVLSIGAGWLFVCMGRADRMFRATAIQGICIVTAFIIGLKWGVEGVAVASSVAWAASRLPMFAYATRDTPVHLGDIGRVIALPFLGSFSAGSIMYIIDSYVLQEAGHGLSMLIGGGMFMLSYMAVIVLFPQGRNTIKETLHLIRQLCDGEAGLRPL